MPHVGRTRGQDISTRKLYGVAIGITRPARCYIAHRVGVHEKRGGDIYLGLLGSRMATIQSPAHYKQEYKRTRTFWLHKCIFNVLARVSRIIIKEGRGNKYTQMAHDGYRNETRLLGTVICDQ